MSPELDVPRPVGFESERHKTSRDGRIVWAGLPVENSGEFQKCLSFRREKDEEPVLKIDPQHCGNWLGASDDGYSHHASFGANGTTASISAYGDVMQMTQFLGKGRSGIFSMDHSDIEEPWQVASRAHDLEALSLSSYEDYTFGIYMEPWLSEGYPTSVQWLNGKWPRYEWQTNGMKIIFQYLVREGVVLHQLLFDNCGSEPQSLPDVRLASEMEISDLDYLHPRHRFESEPTYLVYDSTGPHGYGRVTIKFIDTDEDQEQGGAETCQALALVDIFIDGKRQRMPKRQLQPLGKLEPGQAKEIVVAYKLSNNTGALISWKDLMISAEDANLSKFLREELAGLGDEGMRAYSPLLNLQPWSVDVAAAAVERPESASANTVTVSSRRRDKSQDPSTKPTPASSDQPNDESRNSKISQTLARHLGKFQYLAWRHLEHILSVCAIPIPQSPIDRHAHKWAEFFNKDRTNLIALTCGDMSGHRVCTSASFYAFRFLIDVDRRIPSFGNENSYEIYLRDRIRKTCKGHIKWLAHVWDKRNHKPDSSCFAANYWVTGEEMTGETLQILKITSYAKIITDSRGRTDPERLRIELEWLKDFLTEIFVSWLYALNKLDVRAKYAWPHGKEDGVNTFRLNDHFWIWKALKAMDDLEMWKQLPSPDAFIAGYPEPKLQPRSTGADKTRMRDFLDRVGQKEGFLKLACVTFGDDDTWKEFYQRFLVICKRLSPDKVLRGALQRFTTINEVSGSRMLAVKRSPRDTQFLLDNQDSELVLNQLNPDGMSFFADQSATQLWDQTITVQPFHLENEEYGSRWYYVTRYLLSIMLGIEAKSLNDKEPLRSMQESITSLIGFFGHNGFLGAHLGDNKEPVLFENEQDRDLYYHAGFEVLYVLLQVLAHTSRKRDETITQQDTGDEMTEILRCVRDISSNMNFTGRAKAQRAGLRPGAALVMKESMPSNKIIDTSNICMVEEEEWIHNYPEFLLAARIQLEGDSDGSTETNSNAEIPPEGSSTAALRANLLIKHHSLQDLIHQDTNQLPLTFIADVKKQKLYGQPRIVDPEPWKESPYKAYHNWQLKDKLQNARSAEQAKKRFIWLPQAGCNEPARTLCQEANASDAEKQAVLVFFSRHLKYGNFFSEDTTLALNSWQTELNLTFLFHLPYTGDIKENCKHEKIQDQFIEEPRRNRASMGYRFDGDMFDRYWTCHFVESSHCTQTGLQDHSSPSEKDQESVFKAYNKGKEHFKQWWQRKVLELLLTHRMLEKHNDGSKGIIQQVESILKHFEELSKAGQNRYQFNLTASGLWPLGRNCKDRLQEVADDIKSTLETVEEWNAREAKRGEEKPRWTLNDEKKYRKRIRELQSMIEKDQRRLKKRDLEVERLQRGLEHQEKEFIEQRESARAEEERQAAKRDRERAKRDKQSERNIRWFTYVTIVFAPLSFAEGFYSMGGAPGNELITSLVRFCFAALAITIAVILSAIAVMKAWKNRISEKEAEKSEKGTV